MDGTLFVARAQDQFSGGHALYFWAHLPSTRLALLHQRYSISAAHVRYGKNKGFMSGTLFAFVPCFNRCPGGGVDFIHERRGTIFSANFAITAFYEVRFSNLRTHSPGPIPMSVLD